MIAIFREVFRIMKPTGSFWLNMGDSYASAGPVGGDFTPAGNISKEYSGRARTAEFQEKSLIGQPWRMAIRMQDELGFILRADINWCKQILIYKKDAKYTMGSVMPSSVKDRVNMASEHLFHFTKSKKYFYDIDAVRIPAQTMENRPDGIDREKQYSNAKRNSFAFNYRVRDAVKKAGQPQFKASETEIKNYKQMSEIRLEMKPNTGTESKYGDLYNPSGKNIPNNWLISREPSKEHHFAKFPSMLCEIPILATCPKEICKKCGKIRITTTTTTTYIRKRNGEIYQNLKGKTDDKNFSTNAPRWESKTKITGKSDCGCNIGFEPGIVCDIFMGSGTTAVVARRLGRNFIGIELNEDYIKIAERKLQQQVLRI